MQRLYVLGSIHPGAIVEKSPAQPVTVFPWCSTATCTGLELVP